MEKIKIVAIQMSTVADKMENVRTVKTYLEKIKDEKPDFVILPEMFCCPYQTENFPIYAEEEGGPIWQQLSAYAKQYGVYLIGGSMPEKDAETYRFNPFDLTKVWSHKDYPLIEVGVIELNRNPENYFADVEQSAFNPANVVPGIHFSPDKMLQGRLFAYGDAHRYRLGVNADSIPVNAPRCPMHNYHRDGAMRVDSNGGGAVNYEPNSFGGPVDNHAYNQPPFEIRGMGSHYQQDKDYYTQPGDLYRLVSEDEKMRIHTNVATAMEGVPMNIKVRVVARFYQADERCGKGIAEAAGLDMNEVLAEVKRQQQED